jgi:hypothetical protein
MKVRTGKKFYLAVAIIIIIAAALSIPKIISSLRSEAAIAAWHTEITTATPNFPNQIEAYHRLLQAVGPSEGQDILLSTMPNDSRTHMIQHEAGKYLYETQGLSGIGFCKNYFAGGCYHGFISAVIADRGIADVKNIVSACEQALSSDQQMQCAHGVGHGLLAEVVGYANLPKALDLCQQIFSNDHKKAVNCYDGVFMENNFGAFNVPPPGRFYNVSDPMYPCNIPSVLDKPGAHDYCWGMQSQLTLHKDAYPQFSGDIKKVEAYCQGFPAGSDKQYCFEGIARQIQLVNGDDFAKIRAMCAQLNAADAPQCVWSAAEAAYIYGDHSSAVLDVCESEMRTQKSACYDTLNQGIAISYSLTQNRVAACEKDIPEAAYQKSCAAWMQSPGGMNF